MLKQGHMRILYSLGLDTVGDTPEGDPSLDRYCGLVHYALGYAYPSATVEVDIREHTRVAVYDTDLDDTEISEAIDNMRGIANVVWDRGGWM